VARLLGAAPVAVKQLCINNLLPEDQKNDSKSTSAYKLSESDPETKWKPDIEAFMQELTAGVG
jgi:hypothetical protein